MDITLDAPAAIRYADVIRYGCLFAGLCFAAAVIRLVREPRVQSHPTFRGFKWRLFGLALGVALTCVLQFDRLGEPVNLITLPLSVVLLGVAFYSVWLPVSDLWSETERRLLDL